MALTPAFSPCCPSRVLLQVPKVQVPDYNTHVPEAKEMWIDRIAGKVKGHK
jgi:hypothetical protein